MDYNRVIQEGDETRIELNKDTQEKGYLEIEEARFLLIQSLTAYCKSLGMK